MANPIKKLLDKLKQISLKDLLQEVKKIASIGLACKASTIIEKLLWIVLGISGVVWAVFFLTIQVQDWKENAGILTKGKIELKYPAITICPKVSTKYAIAERLANLIDPLKIPKELQSLRQEFFMCASGGLLGELDSYRATAYNNYRDFCLDTSSPEKGCKVNLGVDLHSLSILIA